MVNITEWLNQNYPKETRAQITELDISSKNLEGSFVAEGFTNLRKANLSFNMITGINVNDCINVIEEIDWSHNLDSGSPVFGTLPLLKKLNFSFNNYVGFAPLTPVLTHLDASNNKITQLDLKQISRSLVELKCSGNPLNNLTLALTPNLNIFDCLGTKLIASVSSSTIFSISSTTTTYTNNPTLLGSTIGLGVYSGISTLG